MSWRLTIRLRKLIRSIRKLISRDIEGLEYQEIEKSGLFDTDYYLAENPDLKAALLMDPLDHFIRFGWKEGRSPSILFDTKSYLEVYPDVKSAGMNPLIHYLRSGKQEGRLPRPLNLIPVVDKTAPLSSQKWGILANEKTRFVAELFAHTLRKYLKSAEIFTRESDEYPLDAYVVIAPEMHLKFPDRKKSIAFHIDHSVSKKGFDQKYLCLLDSFPVILVSQIENISYLWENGIRYPKVYYVPLTADEGTVPGDMAGDHFISSNNKEPSYFEFMLQRFLLGEGYLKKSDVDNLEPFSFKSNDVVLSLPETVERRASYIKYGIKDVQFFDGIRRSPGWMGCGLSYKYLARSALEQNLEKLLVVEDDVEFFPDHAEKMEIINEYLERHTGQWDIFSGVMALTMDECRILHVDKYKGITFVTVDKMISTVFNVYFPSALERLALWDPNVESFDDQIDRYLAAQNDLKILTTLPYLVGHKAVEDSTIWQRKNFGFSQMIKNSEAVLAKKIEEYDLRNCCIS